ncbi:MAG TPA: arginyltransferase [Phycisphaerae bacterium]|nr:arginyltransferase [Phycisphaerae bacterium]HRY69950.1 arginyltransferase [Phycisphaerae bacterium]HSA27159.1 arginyltransferase [Phycisphaerae bacterium]
MPGTERPCSYLPNRLSCAVSFMTASLSPGLYHSLMDQNFRRSGRLFYRPTCRQCDQCQAIRVPVGEFRPDRAQNRCLRRNRDLSVEVGDPDPSAEKYDLFRRYLDTRHDGKMADSPREFVEFLYDSPIVTREVVFRLGAGLVGAAIIDVEPKAVSTVYCFFEPDLPERSLGTFNILWSIAYCRQLGVPHLYLGYYVRDCRKMNYKSRFRPCEVLDVDGNWKRYLPV